MQERTSWIHFLYSEEITDDFAWILKISCEFYELPALRPAVQCAQKNNKMYNDMTLQRSYVPNMYNAVLLTALN